MRHLRQQQNERAAVAAVDPRTRLLAAATLLALVISSRGSAFPWQVAGICLPVALIAGMPPRVLLLRMLHPLFIAAVILILKTFLGEGATVELFGLATFSITGHPEGLREGLLVTSRIMGAVSVAVLLSQVMTFTETMAALAWLRMPRSLVDVAMFAWRSLFMLYDDAGVVYTAQKNRLGYCGMRRGLKSFGAMAGMLTIRAFDSSQAMTVAMTQRGYDGSLPLLRGSRLGWPQLAGLSAFVIAATAAWKLQN
ncbi:MAG: cobalt ECF transporter T component CbiQ [Desulfuromonadales bacterium]|nr:cobalt ECF transporter T component CbiQ [Desulfuromonadales bacterium]